MNRKHERRTWRYDYLDAIAAALLTALIASIMGIVWWLF